ncbi:MFS transporter [Aquabacter cavernae]|uniref:MFS transporter n=1 Tax=Aquabacter cavernae TaxID=2496029 RepID=UPI000F8DB979|nr:MFS transporter [Aquabacter cavernae]
MRVAMRLLSQSSERPVKLALASAYGTLFFSFGIYMPFFPLWLTDRGMTPQQIGAAIAIPMCARLAATPLLGILSDRVGRPKAVLVILAFAATLFMAVLSLGHTPLAIYVALSFGAMAWSPSFALLDAYATRQARAGRVDYGRSRLWGSATFIAANLVGGVLIAQAGASMVLLLMIAGQASFVVAMLVLPELPRPPVHTTPHLSLPRTRAVLVLGVLASALIQASHATLYAFATVHWTERGFSLSVIGGLWALGVVSEIVLFRYGTWIVARIGPSALLAAGGLAALVRFGILAMDPPMWILLPLQVLHGLTFGAAFLGLVELVARNTPEHRAGTAQSLAAWTGSLAMACASFAAGQLWVAYGHWAFLASAALGLAGACLALASHLANKKRPVL